MAARGVVLLPDEEAASRSHLVLIPSFNTGARLLTTVREARRHWNPVWVVVDGSTDGSGDTLANLSRQDRGLRVLIRSRNAGKGAAILDGLREAAAQGFTHVLTMDADGQHSAESIPAFMALSFGRPEAMILGRPVFDRSAPWPRVAGRRLSNGLAHVETLWHGVGDSLFGFRIYPIPALKAIMESGRWMRGYDFDVEAAVRLHWKGVPTINRPAPVRYFTAAEGGVSHFRYGRDNLLIGFAHLRLMCGFLHVLPRLLARTLRSSRR